jgi:hypothetical protein
MGLEEFKKGIRTALDDLNRKEPPKPVRAGFIFINADRSDQQLAQSLFKAFNESHCDALLPMDDSSASAKEVEDDLEANLIDCKGLLLVYGNASQSWVRAQVRRVFKVESQRQEKLRLKTILRGPPPAKPDPGVTGFDLIDWQDGATADWVGKIARELQL